MMTLTILNMHIDETGVTQANRVPASRAEGDVRRLVSQRPGHALAWP